MDDSYPVGYPIRRDPIRVPLYTYTVDIEVDGKKDTLPCSMEVYDANAVVTFRVVPGTEVRKKLDKISRTKCKRGEYTLTLRDNFGTVHLDRETVEFHLTGGKPSRDGDWIFDQLIWQPGHGRPKRTVGVVEIV